MQVHQYFVTCLAMSSDNQLVELLTIELFFLSLIRFLFCHSIKTKKLDLIAHIPKNFIHFESGPFFSICEHHLYIYQLK